MKTTTVAATTLVEDLALYPRNQVDDQHVTDLVRALSSGAQLPPVVAERKTNRIVDGVHRRRAQMKLLGEAAKIEVDFRDYESEADFYLDAVRLNAGHGRRLDRQDQTRIVLRLQELKVDERTIASALHIPEPDIRTLAVRIVYDSAGTAVPQKRGLEHLRGQRLSDQQIDAMKSVRSAEAGRLCLELLRLLENDLIDYEDPKVEQRLKQLATAVTAALRTIRTQAKGTKKEAVPA
jgi:hypothetical protein